jgi:ketosteroid isomerase-like protein
MLATPIQLAIPSPTVISYETVKTLLILVATAVAMLAADKAADEKSVRAALDEFNAAAKAGDKAKLEKLLGDDLVYVHSLGKIENKAECVDALVKSKIEFTVAPGAKVQVHGNTAIVSGKMHANTPTGKTHLDFMQVWIKSGKGWQMVARHTLRLQS